jgi:hypothetical protein
MQSLDETVTSIISLATANDSEAVRRSVIQADAYLVYEGPLNVHPHRTDLIRALCERGPNTPLMEEIIKAIENGETPGG